MKAMVASGLGISIVPFQSVAHETRSGTLSVARIRGQQLVRETGWVYRTGERVPRVVQEMMATLTRIAPQLQLSAESRPAIDAEPAIAAHRRRKSG